MEKFCTRKLGAGLSIPFGKFGVVGVKAPTGLIRRNYSGSGDEMAGKRRLSLSRRAVWDMGNKKHRALGMSGYRLAEETVLNLHGKLHPPPRNRVIWPDSSCFILRFLKLKPESKDENAANRESKEPEDRRPWKQGWKGDKRKAETDDEETETCESEDEEDDADSSKTLQKCKSMKMTGIAF
ncbi:UNVERIFIED_CONTAM: hypothetical protein PYX00_004589 [Menopon gallinae]|uniref:Uncharacterized protein n=1 Tax=Menopon gallinae TaxID=328185 RepID=A0AAW2I4B9_9NEOP